MSIFDKMSEPEKEVGKFLEELGIWWKYEYPIFVYDDNDRPRIWTPDFFLPLLGMYLEVCGSAEFDYDFRDKVYDKNVCRVIFVHYYKDEDIWKTFLVQRINDIQDKRIGVIASVLRNAKRMGIEVQLPIIND